MTLRHFFIYAGINSCYDSVRHQSYWKPNRKRLMANLEFAPRQVRFIAGYLSFAILLLSVGSNLQAKNATTKAPAKNPILLNPVNPFGAGPISNYTKPVRNGLIQEPAVGSEGGKEPIEPTEPCPPLNPDDTWAFTLSQSYQFFNDRSKVGGISLNSNSATVDLTATDNKRPWTCIDVSYMYSHESGSSPSGINQSGHQNVGSLRVLQPIPLSADWVPATLSTKGLNYQLGVILSANYGKEVTSTEIPQIAAIHSSTRTFLGNALLDFQLAWFPRREAREGSKSEPCNGSTYSTYPGFLLELSSGIQYSTTHLKAAESGLTATSSGEQLTYQNICCATYSFSCRFGLLAAVEWDAPISSTPLAGTQPFYANTAVFTGGLVYNIYAYRNPNETDSSPAKSWQKAISLYHWSASLLYSYTAFNPLFQTNQVQVQVSYTF
jgi:hypothetical protein